MENVKAPTSKRPLRHFARFILLGIYSGTRAGAIAAASPIPALGRSYVDLERGRYYRRKQGSAKTTTNGSDPVALACAPAALAPDRSRGEALCRVQRPAGDLSQDCIQECR